MSVGVARLASVNVGMPREVRWQGRTVFTGIWKEPVQGSRLVRRTNIDGDGQGDRAGHGGEQRAVYVYQLDSYRYWREQLHRDDFVFGQFGENFTVEGLGDDEVCIGDRYRIGSALFEVTQPRVTCYRVGIRMNEPRMAALLTGHGRPGFYLRVIEEGAVQAGDDIVKVATGAGRMSVASINALLYLDRHPDPQLLQRALQLPALSPGWQASLRALFEQQRGGATGDGNAGLALFGPPPAWPGFRTLRVVAKRPETATVLSLELEADDGAPLPHAASGTIRHAQARTRRRAPPLVRSYSLSGSPDSPRYRITVKVEPHGAAGGYLRANVEVGDRIKVAAPRGQFTLEEGAQPIVLVSAGVGVTPCSPCFTRSMKAGRRVTSGGSMPRATAPSMPLHRRYGRCSRRCQTRTAACGTADPILTTTSGPTTTSLDTSPRMGSLRRGRRSTASSTCAVRPHSWLRSVRP